MKLNEALERVEYMIRSSCPEAGGSNIGDCNKCLRNPCDDMKALLTITNAVSADRPSEETFEWCTDCKEYDQQNHCCHRWTKVIRDTVDELEKDRRPHGEWKVIHNALGETKCQCNQCQHYVNSGDDKNFCPNCGASMGKEEGESN